MRNPAGGGGAVGLFKTIANSLALKTFNKPDCLADFAKLGITADQFGDAAARANIQNGVGSSVPASSLYSSAPNELLRRNANSVKGTVGGILAVPGTVAVSQLGGNNIYINPSMINTSLAAYEQNVGVTFHEIVHNVSGLTDSDIQRALGIKEQDASDNITQKIKKDCL